MSGEDGRKPPLGESTSEVKVTVDDEGQDKAAATSDEGHRCSDTQGVNKNGKVTDKSLDISDKSLDISDKPLDISEKPLDISDPCETDPLTGDSASRSRATTPDSGGERNQLLPTSKRSGSSERYQHNGDLPAVEFRAGGHPMSSPGSDNGPTEGSTTSSLSGVRHRIRMEEVAPSSSSIIDEEVDWRLQVQLFSAKKQDKEDVKMLPRRVRRYYKTQDELITAFEELHLEVDDAMEGAEAVEKTRRIATILSKVSFGLNMVLLVVKCVAAALSGSLAVVSAVVDSAVDLVSGGLMWWSNRAMKYRDIYRYPQGRTKLEPVSIVVVSVVMALASVQMIRESVEKIVDYSNDAAEPPVFELPTIIICAFTVIVKLVLWLVCRRVKNATTQTLAADHRNDVVSNSGALICGYIGYKWWCYTDPIGAIAISIYIIASWFITGWEQIKMLTGHTARPDFLKKITWIAVNHHHKVLLIDTVRAFHFGSNFLAEVDIVLPETMNLREAHDIGETLQLKIEKLPEVERAFVHLDYECEHHPFSEHKVV